MLAAFTLFDCLSSGLLLAWMANSCKVGTFEWSARFFFVTLVENCLTSFIEKGVFQALKHPGTGLSGAYNT